MPVLLTPPGADERIRIALADLTTAPGQEAFLRFRFLLREAASWAPAGHEIAWAQLPIDLPRRPAETVPKVARGSLRIRDLPRRVFVAGDSFELAFSKELGRIDRFRWRGRPVMLAGPTLQVWRGATDNDGIKQWTGQAGKPLGRWRKAGVDALVAERPSLTTESGGNAVLVTIEQVFRSPTGAGAIRHRHIYKVHTSGRVTVSNVFDVDPGLADLPRLGVTMTLPDAFESLAWFGRGPLETYADRRHAAWIGRFESTVREQYTPYVLPQEHGNKTGVRWLRLASPDAAMRFVPEGVCEASATRFTPADLFAATHAKDLVLRDEVIVNLDVAQRGLGTASCGPDTLERYRIPAGRHELTFNMEPS